MNILKTLTVLGAIIATGATVVATPINGDIIFSGVYSTDNADLTIATKFTGFTGVQVIGTPLGDYSSVPANFSPVTYNAFTFDPAGTPVVPLWTFTTGGVTYSFDLTSVTIDTRSTSGLHLIGSGIAKITGLDDTAGSWDLSIGQVGQFHFSAGNSVPDGGATAILVGVGLLGLGALRRKVS